MSYSKIPTRRQFLATTAAAAAAPSILRAAQDDRKLKVGVVGLGGRGSGAARQALTADSNCELHAVGEAFKPKANKSLDGLRKKFGDQVNVPDERIFIGLDAYKKVLDSGVDVVLLTTPPGFRPQHLAAAVEAGKHVFCEKPVAVDSTGVRSVLESVRKAEAKKLSIVTGFCWRYNFARRALYEKVHEGAIGDVVGVYATYLASPVKPMPPADKRPEGLSDVEWQVANWYNFDWLCGDSLVEQAVHSVDKIAWAMKDIDPIAAVGSGGRQIPAHGGNIYDHFNVCYEYPNQVRCHMASRQQRGCYGENHDYITGTKGTALIVRGQCIIRGEQNWRYDGEQNDMYQEEHDTLFRAIRRGEPRNDGEWMAKSTLLAIVGRMAAYTGERVEWGQAQASGEDFAPDDLKWEDDFQPSPTPKPGVTKLVPAEDSGDKQAPRAKPGKGKRGK